jgi:hypothetical protein
MKINCKQFFLIFISSFIFLGCAKNNITLPKTTKEFVKIENKINGYYEIDEGIKKPIIIQDYQYEQNHQLLLWPKTNSKTICFSTFVCLIDIENKGYFTHSGFKGKDNLFKLEGNVKYSVVKKEFYFVNSPEIYHDKKIKMGINTIHSPAINSISTKEVGESMYEKINQFTFDTYTTNLNQDVSVQSGDEYGENIQKFDLNLSGKYEILKWPENGYKTICGKNNVCLVDVNNNNSFSHSAIKNESKLYPLNTPIKYKSIQDVNYNEDSFKYQALYQGKVGNKIKISFREFKDDMARPAFTQDIEYELEGNKPTTIGFKGLRIEVIKATNLNITYSVIKDYN